MNKSFVREKLEAKRNKDIKFEITENKITDSVNVLTAANLDDSIKDISGMLHVLKIVSKEFKIHFTVIGDVQEEIKLKNLP